jgi:transcriptional regulator with XRE-family HTH domain
MPRSIRSEGLLALGQAIVQIREAEGMSQRDFAAKIGYRQSFISKLELGLRRIDVVELVVLARAVGVPASELLAAVEKATPLDQRI